MKKFWKKYWPLLLASLLIVCNAIWLCCDKEAHRNEPKVKVDSTTYVDTIPYLKPIPKDSLILRYDTLKAPLANARKGYDSIVGDSIMEVTGVVPITQKVYRDTSYMAWVSGYRPQLDSIKVLASTHYITKTIVKESKQPPDKRRIDIGLQAGYGVTPCGIQPYLGIGIGVRLWP